MELRWQEMYKALARAIWLATGVFVLVWFLDAVTSTLLFALLALVLCIAFAAPVTWLEKRRVPRWLGTVLVLTSSFLVVGLVGLLIAPIAVEQGTSLWEKAPVYIEGLRARIAGVVQRNPMVQMDSQEIWDRAAPIFQSFVSRAGRYTLSIVGLFIGALLLLTAVAYGSANPRPILSGYLNLFPPALRDQAQRAFSRGSEAVVGWVWSNVIIGAIEAILTFPFLTWLGIPGAAVWAVFVFFAELIPKIGSYILAIPPILVALAVDPLDAVWIGIFFALLQWLVGDVVGAFVRARQMQVHAVSIIVATLAMATAFGLLGAILAVPLLGFAKAFYDEFYGERHDPVGAEDPKVDAMLERRIDPLPE